MLVKIPFLDVSIGNPSSNCFTHETGRPVCPWSRHSFRQIQHHPGCPLCALLSSISHLCFFLSLLWSQDSGGRNQMSARVPGSLPVLVPVWSVSVFSHPAVRSCTSAFRSRHCCVPLVPAHFGWIAFYNPADWISEFSDIVPAMAEMSAFCTVTAHIPSCILLCLWFSALSLWQKPTLWQTSCSSSLNVLWWNCSLPRNTFCRRSCNPRRVFLQASLKVSGKRISCTNYGLKMSLLVRNWFSYDLIVIYALSTNPA